MFKDLFIEKYRPQTLGDIVLEDTVRAKIEQFIKNRSIPHLLFSGPPGIGKTSLAKIIVKELGGDYLYINASDESGIDTIRNKVQNFAQTVSLSDTVKIVVLDEADGMSTAGGGNSAQNVLRNVMETYSDICRFVLTCNSLAKVIKPIQSRCQRIDLSPPIKGVLSRIVTILAKENITLDAEQKAYIGQLVKRHYPDIRTIIGELEQSIIDGNIVLKNSNDVSKNVAAEVFEHIKNKKNITTIREYVISKSIDFNNDYNLLLKNMFNVAYELPDEKTKRDTMLIISKYLFQNGFVMDQEINATACYLELMNAL
jgi:DNA polymerase III delta prime subunit